ncbi:MAG: PRC-barrel domain-containing protein [Firmicutes bacterium]|nr:PRC-barrel domain-containing protein [Bacillota bacterium]
MCCELLGLPVIDRKRGKHLGRVDGLLYDPDKAEFLGLIIRRGGVMPRTRYLPREQVEVFGEDALLVAGKDAVAVIHMPSMAEWFRSLRPAKALCGTPVVTAGGRWLGTIRDLVVDVERGSVEGYLVTDGLPDILVGRSRFLSHQDIVLAGEDVMFARSEPDLGDCRGLEAGELSAGDLS